MTVVVTMIDGGCGEDEGGNDDDGGGVLCNT